MERTAHPSKIWLACPGVGHVRRGFESFTEELFAVLTACTRFRVTLFKGAGTSQGAVRRLPCILRTSALAARIVRWLPRLHVYAVEQISFGVLFVAALVLGRPDAVLVSDRLLAKMIYRARFLYPGTAIVFSNGAPFGPPFYYAELVQHVSPVQRDEALAAGEPVSKHRCVPYGCDFSQLRADPSGERRRQARRRLDIDADARVVVSVGHLSTTHKRMDYVLRETAAALPDATVLLAGQSTEETPAVERLAAELFPVSRRRLLSVPADQIGEVYAAADIFVLGSLVEAFGRVVAEALAAGLPVLLHDSPVLRFVAGDEGRYGDFEQPGALAGLLRAAFAQPIDESDALRRAALVEGRFSWATLLPDYVTMFEEAVAARRGT